MKRRQVQILYLRLRRLHADSEPTTRQARERELEQGQGRVPSKICSLPPLLFTVAAAAVSLLLQSTLIWIRVLDEDLNYFI